MGGGGIWMSVVLKLEFAHFCGPAGESVQLHAAQESAQHRRQRCGTVAAHGPAAVAAVHSISPGRRQGLEERVVVGGGGVFQW